MRRALLLFSIVFTSFITFIQAEIVRRGAFDVGSGETKLTIADVDTETQKIVKVHYQNTKIIELRKDLAASSNGQLSQEIVSKLLQAFHNYQADTAAFSPTQWFGIGTSVFRTAQNGQEILDQIKKETGITIYLASQHEEGEIGFMSAVAASGLDKDQVISWDSGGGSFQITTLNRGQIEIYGTEFAITPALEVLIQNIRKTSFDKNATPNPISLEEVSLLSQIIEQEKLPALPKWLANRKKQVVAFGGYTSIFSQGQIATGKKEYAAEDILDALHKFSGKTDQELSMFPKPHEAILGLTLLYSVMDYCKIKDMIYKPTNGSCEGLLIMGRYW